MKKLRLWTPLGDAPGRLSRDRGAVIIEFALIAPVFFLMLFGVIDFGRYFFVEIGTNAAAHNAARMYSLGPVKDEDTVAMVAGSALGAVSVASLNRHPNQKVNVTVSCDPAASCTARTFSTASTTVFEPCKIDGVVSVKVQLTLYFDWILQFPSMKPQSVGVMRCAY